RAGTLPGVGLFRHPAIMVRAA
ncbi:MAG: hypothetical protein QOD96_3473, partial [Pseudonocardiales bacterium]|nr:hypothetical protein [Pseudonocardiales bacterium]